MDEVKKYIEELGHGEQRVRRNAAEALGKLGDPRAVDPLVKTLGDKGWRVRLGAAKALEQMSWQPSTPEEDAACSVAAGRWDRVIALGQAAEAAVTALLEDPDLETRLLAVGCLEIIGGSRRWSGWFGPAAEGGDAETDQNRRGTR